jgi:hypothetical protein
MQVHPPQPRRWMLATAVILLVGWLVFLLAMALSP